MEVKGGTVTVSLGVSYVPARERTRSGTVCFTRGGTRTTNSEGCPTGEQRREERSLVGRIQKDEFL